MEGCRLCHGIVLSQPSILMTTQRACNHQSCDDISRQVAAAAAAAGGGRRSTSSSRGSFSVDWLARRSLSDARRGSLFATLGRRRPSDPAVAPPPNWQQNRRDSVLGPEPVRRSVAGVGDNPLGPDGGTQRLRANSAAGNMRARSMSVVEDPMAMRLARRRMSVADGGRYPGAAPQRPSDGAPL